MRACIHEPYCPENVSPASVIEGIHANYEVSYGLIIRASKWGLRSASEKGIFTVNNQKYRYNRKKFQGISDLTI